MQSWRVPIVFRKSDGKLADNIHHAAHPFIDIELAESRNGLEAGWTRTRALVDTGSSYTLINPSYLKAKNCPAVRKIEMAGNFSRHETLFYRLCIRAVGAEVFTLDCEVGELHVPIEGECLAVLGMDYLRYGRTVIEGPAGNSYFELLESRIRLAEATDHPV